MIAIVFRCESCHVSSMNLLVLSELSTLSKKMTAKMRKDPKVSTANESTDDEATSSEDESHHEGREEDAEDRHRRQIAHLPIPRQG